jgi:hypothetical protein
MKIVVFLQIGLTGCAETAARQAAKDDATRQSWGAEPGSAA